MFDFLTDEVFQIVVITALFVIGVMLFMLYKRPSENISQYLDDIDYRIDKMNKKLDELTNTFVNGLMVDEDESDASSVHEETVSEEYKAVSDEHEEAAAEEHEAVSEEQEAAAEENEEIQIINEVKSLNYDGIEFSDIPNFSTDTSVINDNEELQELHEEAPEVNEKKRVNIIKRIIQSEE